MKAKMIAVWVVVVILSVGAGVLVSNMGGTQAQSTITGDVILDADGNELPQWANKIVYYKLITSDKFTGVDVTGATAKVYDEEPAEWMNSRGDFDQADEYTVYSESSGEILINKETPANYFVVLEATGYNTEFLMVEIPDGSGRSDSLVDYQAQPDLESAEMTQLGATTDEDFAFTLANATSKTIKDTVLLTIDENTEFRGWKVIVNDEEGFSTDTSGSGDYDEGISKMTISVGGKSVKVFDPANGVDLFDSNDEYTMDLSGVTIADEDNLVVNVEIVADTSDSASANDELWGEGEGVLSYLKIYDAESNLFATVDLTA